MFFKQMYFNIYCPILKSMQNCLNVTQKKQFIVGFSIAQRPEHYQKNTN